MTSKFPSRPVYPEAAGWKEPTTSRDAAIGVEKSGKARTLRNRVLAWLEAGNVGTTEEITKALGEYYASVQPRTSELRRQGLIEPTGRRRRTEWGRASHEWRAAQTQQQTA